MRTSFKSFFWQTKGSRRVFLSLLPPICRWWDLPAGLSVTLEVRYVFTGVNTNTSVTSNFLKEHVNEICFRARLVHNFLPFASLPHHHVHCIVTQKVSCSQIGNTKRFIRLVSQNKRLAEKSRSKRIDSVTNCTSTHIMQQKASRCRLSRASRRSQLSQISILLFIFIYHIYKMHQKQPAWPVQTILRDTSRGALVHHFKKL